MEKDALVRLSRGENPNATLRKTWSIVEHQAELEWKYLASPQIK